jgi:hypothetical protein
LVGTAESLGFREEAPKKATIDLLREFMLSPCGTHKNRFHANSHKI